MFVDIYCLLYGDHARLHLRLLKSLVRYLPSGEAHVVIWANVVCHRTAKWLHDHAPEDWDLVFSEENVPKYTAMRKMLHETHKPTTPWIVWFDDDSHVVQPDWWSKTRKYIEEKESESIVYFGERWYVHHLPGQPEFIKKASWYAGRAWELCPTRKKGVRKPGITFATGAYWWLRTDVMKRLDWPDMRLRHNGGDTLLGEAVRQSGLPFHNFHYGVKVNDALRRGYHEKPAGASVNVRR
ncbi:hypothetical protein LCGC14_0898100 [marine sediment metagenome]|uniref:Glycosyltransferase 2-like domain-containing protein n=1 Tax=marine sediment metagenome TaxID=412755 RepID=A0A0F9RGB5_9ZZZZ